MGGPKRPQGHPCLAEEHGALLLRVKAVPGASRDAVAGALGDRLKVRVAAPPEAGKANEALRRLLARTLDTRPANVEIVAGTSTPEKVLRIVGVTLEQASRALGL